LTETPYDVVSGVAWALMILGALLVVTSLIRYWGSRTRR
jgi:hypothetical protein